MKGRNLYFYSKKSAENFVYSRDYSLNKVSDLRRLIIVVSANIRLKLQVTLPSSELLCNFVNVS
jgi:hypothetical protein